MPFKFQQFSIEDAQTPMKVGIDAVILGAWASLNEGEKVLEIGSGTGIISLMLAQRFSEAKIDAIEINPFAFKDLVLNVNNSPWENRINTILGDFNSISFNVKYNTIISNPPFFNTTENNSTEGRIIARQTKSLTPEQICSKSMELLLDRSSLIVIFPYNQRSSFINAALSNGLYLWEELRIKDKQNSIFKRSIMVFKNYKPKQIGQNNLILKNEDGSFTKEFQLLTKDFYLP